MDLQTIIRKLELNESSISTFLGGIVMLVVVFLMLSYFGEKKTERLASTESDVKLEETNFEENESKEETSGQISATRVRGYEVKAGDDLWKIAEMQYNDGYKWVLIAEANGLTNPDLIVPGEQLDIPQIEEKKTEEQAAETLPEKPANYMVQRGDYLWKIAQKYYGDGYKWVKIWQANRDQVFNPDVILVGQLLTLP